jgi:hypothetical protein
MPFYNQGDLTPTAEGVPDKFISIGRFGVRRNAERIAERLDYRGFAGSATTYNHVEINIPIDGSLSKKARAVYFHAGYSDVPGFWNSPYTNAGRRIMEREADCRELETGELQPGCPLGTFDSALVSDLLQALGV